MSYVTIQDQYPGRCENYRVVVSPNGQAESLRCLDYEDRPHICCFPKPSSPAADGYGWGIETIYSHTSKPKPWVKPK